MFLQTPDNQAQIPNVVATSNQLYGDEEDEDDNQFFDGTNQPGDALEEPDSLMLLNLIKNEIVNELHLSNEASEALAPAFAAFETALK